MLKRLFSYLVLGLTFTNTTFGMDNIKNYVRDQITVKNTSSYLGKMAAYMALNFSSTLAHEYGHALVSYYLQGETSHIFLGKNSWQVDVNHKKLMLEKNKNKLPQFSFVGYNPAIGFCSSIGKNSGNAYYEALNDAAGPIAGSLFDLATIKILRSFGLVADNYTDGLLKIFIEDIATHPLHAFILKSILTDNSLESEMHARLLQNIFNLLPIAPNTDGYKLLVNLSNKEKTDTIANIVNPLFTMSTFLSITAFSGAKIIKYLAKTDHPKFYKEKLVHANGKELTDAQTLLKLTQEIYRKLKGRTN